MKVRFVRVWAVMGLLLVGSYAEGQPAAAQCTLMDLTTQDGYALPVLPPVLEESLSNSFSLSEVPTPIARVHVWVKVLQYSGHPEDKLEIFFSDKPPVSAGPSQIAAWGKNVWRMWAVPAPSVALADPVVLQIKATTRTDVANDQPTLILVGAVQLSGTPLAAGPTEVNTLRNFEYTSNLTASNFAMPGIQDAPAGVFADAAWPAVQDSVVRFGGLGRPRIAVSFRYEPGALVAEGEGEGEGEPVVTVPETLQLFFGDTPFESPIDLTKLSPIPPYTAQNAWLYDGGSCWRIFNFIPPHLMGTSQRPKVGISIDPVTNDSRLIVDDFTLTYVTPALEQAFPTLVELGNIIENGDFEDGAAPFVIQSPLGLTTCPLITKVVKAIDDACHGGSAAVFDRDIFQNATIVGCSVEQVVGRGQVGTLTILGWNLASVTGVILVPELYQGNFLDTGNFIQLSPSSMVEPSGDLEQLKFGFNFTGPFNENNNGEMMCTDGVAIFFSIVQDEIGTLPLEGCAVLIDTIPPELVVTDVTGTDAALGEPSIYAANRVLPDVGRGPFPGFWVPGMQDGNIMPKGLSSFASEDMNVYLNAGTRQDVPYSQGNVPMDTLRFSVAARFFDSTPIDFGGTPYNVTRAGFLNAIPAPVSPFVYPGATAGSVRWNGTAPTPVTITSFAAVPSGDPAVDLNVTWQAEAAPGGQEPWRALFKFEATDLAGNVLRLSRYNSVNIYWLHRTQAALKASIDTASGPVELPWGLNRSAGDLPGAAPSCAPLARFSLFRKDGETLTLLGSSSWQQGPLRETTILGSEPLLQWLDANHGNNLCISVIGADEAGNIQFIPPAYAGGSTISESDLTVAEIAHICWTHEARVYPNDALDTDIQVNLVHENYTAGMVREYGPATRVPLPAPADACDTRVNAFASFRAVLPASDSAIVAGVIWKLYKDGTLVARGVVDPQFNYKLLGNEEPLFKSLLFACADTYTSADLVDFVGGAFLQEARSLPKAAYLNGPPIGGYNPFNCPNPPVGVGDGFAYRLGDEGNLPDPADPNAASSRRREIRYTLTAQTVVVRDVTTNDVAIDQTPASARFSVYVREVDEQVRDESPVREFGR